MVTTRYNWICTKCGYRGDLVRYGEGQYLCPACQPPFGRGDILPAMAFLASLAAVVVIFYFAIMCISGK